MVGNVLEAVTLSRRVDRMRPSLLVHRRPERCRVVGGEIVQHLDRRVRDADGVVGAREVMVIDDEMMAPEPDHRRNPMVAQEGVFGMRMPQERLQLRGLFRHFAQADSHLRRAEMVDAREFVRHGFSSLALRCACRSNDR